MFIHLHKSDVRSFLPTDASSIARHADNRKIWINLRDSFPHPYSIEDAVAFIAFALAEEPETAFAIAVDGRAVGAIGFRVLPDVERVTAEVGYWLGEPLWGRGIVTEVLAAMTPWAIETYGLTRVFAVPFEWNAASMRVLEKVGYVFEGRMRRSAIKDGRIVDQLLYARVVPA
ncbi:MAG: family N-acetyltransferase [Candidatus Krumholzibacteriota bacterium]|jgi:RimJ/RimL family protein N-acetyltransferase|nr:family N-acetyltransferase [Candidatus Krumholzibacteriota bacterium]